MKTRIWVSLLFLFGLLGFAQNDTTLVEIDSLDTDTLVVLSSKPNQLYNPSKIQKFYQKLEQLEKEKKGVINLVHIGDSHIQADLMTDRIRKNLQNQFGNAGRGLVFPHRLAGTNGASDYKITSNVKWQSHRNIHTPNGSPVGISGFSLQSNAKDIILEFQTRFEESKTNRIKVLTPDNRPNFLFATNPKNVVVERVVPKVVTHKIRNGEVLGSIADKYDVSIQQLKKANGLKSDRIRPGKTLKIPTSGTQIRTTYKEEFDGLPLENKGDFHQFNSAESLQKFHLIASEEERPIALSGLVLENNEPGIIYHAIGVNGAKFSDYNKYPNFFKELKALQPDVLVLGFGTNESFDKMSAVDFLIQVRTFVSEARSQNPEVEIIVYSPPPSLFKRRIPNTFVRDYADSLSSLCDELGLTYWDMYEQLGGYKSISRNAAKGWVGADKVHYTVKGYYVQADMFTQAILEGFQLFKSSR